ncbi:probable L-type lectin-domain containing receptor kinase S.5 [Phragmites australis]|uniref:probable L-type lectin-domain containing receptor kinase S.5 n=1 Tax=Phragmites australis TaxID=29695 RepID=UPI002D77D879|nr:probable L-type lectin-domain containing receptor kinase S.5 [Phragmites australis]
MAFLVSKLPLPFVPCFCTTVLLLICALPSSSLAKSCKYSGSGQDQYGNHTDGLPFEQTGGFLVFKNSRYSEDTGLECGLGSYMKTHYPAFNLSDNAWFFITQIDLWEYNVEGMGLYEASFSFVFTMSIYQHKNQTKANSSLVFAINSAIRYNSMPSPPNRPSNPTSDTVAGSHVSAQIGTVYDGIYVARKFDPGNFIWVQIDIESPGNSSVANKYSVWIDYDHVGHRMSVYVNSGEGTPKPLNAIANTILNISDIMSPLAFFGFFSSMGQLLQLDTWNLTIDKLPDFYVSGSQGKRTIILSSVFGSAAAAAIMAAVVYLYFNSKYRRWTKEQEKLAKIMQGLPGVPAQVDYADIRKATKNFHETMKLGKGGFGAVYRCTLPAAAASRTGPAMEVAVKKFMREVEDRRYNDFLAEVSIINRLRHKNIVPLVGWSYNKGEPLLVYEYMPNGSLDQHLFRGGGNGQQHEGAAIQHWDNRYGIARDIATGLHYVHHEHEPMVLHRDIKASNIMLDSTFRARLGDFGIACTIAVDRSSVTGVAGTWGYIAPDYAISHKATRQSDIYAFGVLVLEVVTGKKWDFQIGTQPDGDHITDWVWRLHREGKLLEAVDAGVLAAEGHQLDAADEAKRLLLLGLACTNPNPLNRPSMVEVVQVITKLAPPPEVPLETPRFVWPPEDWRSRNSVYSTAVSTNWDESSASTIELVQVSQEQPPSTAFGGHGSVYTTATSGGRAGTESRFEETDQNVAATR